MKTRFPAYAVLMFVVLLNVGLMNYAYSQQSEPSVDTPSEDSSEDSSTGQNIDPDNPLPENTTPGKLSVQLSGTAIGNNATELVITPKVFDSGLVEIGETRQQTVFVTHGGAPGSDAIQINDVQLFGANPNEYTVDFNGFQTLQPGDVVPVEVTFTPVVPGDKLAGLRMSVEGLTAPVVLMFEGRSRFPLSSELLISDDDVGFGQTSAGKATTKTITLTNDGEPSAPAVNITNLTLSGQNAGSFSSDFTQTVLQPGEILDVKVTLSDKAFGFNQAELTIEHDGFNDEIVVNLEGTKVPDGGTPIDFDSSKLKGANITKGTSLQFGPDGKLYVAEVDGLIKIYTIKRNGKNNYNATLENTITSVAQTPNHNDDGTPVNLGMRRLVTGIFVTGTAGAPIIYLASSDPRQAAGPSGTDANLDTNSGILHKLTKSGNNWIKQDLVRGIPRSEENHVANGLVVTGNTVYLITGGHTNQGAPSNNFAFTAEYALSAAVLEIDLAAIGNSTYDLPTLDDEDRAGVNDANDPFGGNDGKNQAKLIPTSPVKVFSTGLRNAYDIVKASNGKMYTFDNGPNTGWGDDPAGNCTNNIDEGGNTISDQLHIVSEGSYAGHPNPTRGSKNNTFNDSNPQTPIEGPAIPADCNYKAGGQGDGSLTTITGSTNGITEYTATNFFGQMQGDLVVASFNKKITRIELSGNGNAVTGKQVILNNINATPLDITAQGDDDVFPGTIWFTDFIGTDIWIMEPEDY